MSTKVIIQNARLSYPALFKPKESQDGGEPRYQATILIPKTDTATIQTITTAIQNEMAAAMQPNGAWKGAQPPAPMITLYDGDQVQPRNGKPWGDECKGHMVLRTSSTSAPDVVDQFGNKAMDASKFYAGCYCHYSVTFAPYNNKQLGIGAYLNCVMFARDGEPLEAHSSAAEDFASLIAASASQASAAPTAYGMPAMPAQVPAAPAPAAPATPTMYGMPPEAPSYPAPAAPAPAAPQQMPGGFGGFYGIPGQQ